MVWDVWSDGRQYQAGLKGLGGWCKIVALHAWQNKGELDIVPSFEVRKKRIELGFFLSAGFSAGLHGDEWCSLSLKGIMEHDWGSNELRHVTLPLLWRFNEEACLNFHLIPITDVTQSEIEHRFWTEFLLKTRQEIGDDRGWMFKNSSWNKYKTSWLSGKLFLNY